MRDEYDFSGGKCGAAIPSPGKTRIALMLEDDVIEHFRGRAKSLSNEDVSLTVATLRRVLREELHSP